MAKKSFKAGFDALLGENHYESKQNENRKNSVLERNSDTRYTIIIDKKVLDKIKFIAFLKRKHIKEIFSESLIKYISNYETENGTISLTRDN